MATRSRLLELSAAVQKASGLLLLLALIGPAPAGASDTGRRFFYERVLPRLIENGCPACHGVGYVRPQVTVYEDALPFLAMGDTPESSVMLYKIANLRSIAPDRPTHVGGQRCVTLDVEPCATIRQWWQAEFGKGARQ
jgi:hypothetical protein